MKNSSRTFLKRLGLAGLLLLLVSSCTQSDATKQTEPSDDIADIKLRDWMPESIHKAGNTDIQQAKYPVIDLHAHAYAKTEEEVDKRVEIMDAAGIEKSLILTKATGDDFKEIHSLYSKYPDRFEVYCGIDYEGFEEDGWSQKAVEQLRRDVEAGCTGLGEMHDKGAGMGGAPGPGMHPDDPRMDAIFEEAASLEIPVNLHVAEPIWMYEPMDSTNDGLMRAHTWQVKDQDQIVGHDGMIEIMDKTLERHRLWPRTWPIPAMTSACWPAFLRSTRICMRSARFA